jgi:hypothetical protein
MFRDRNQTITKAMSFLCAPDTIDPPRPRGGLCPQGGRRREPKPRAVAMPNSFPERAGVGHTSP